MFIFRPLNAGDKESIFELAGLSETGLTTLTPHLPTLEKRLDDALRHITAPPSSPGGENYIFVLENRVSGKMIGTAGILAKVGGFQPFWSYQVKTKRRYSKTLQMGHEIKYLQLKTEHNGPSEIGMLFLHPKERKSGLGRFLSLSRFMFMAAFPRLFESKVLAEMRGVVDPSGHAPFWEAVGRHFIHLEYSKADYMTMLDKSFIEDLFPRHPIYIDLLPKDARDVIGKVHKDTIPALNLLLSEGFQYINEVDIFEAGPTLAAPLKKIRTLRECQNLLFFESDTIPQKASLHLAACGKSPKDFLCGLCMAEIKGNRAILEPGAAKALNLSPGDRIYISPLKSKGSADGN